MGTLRILVGFMQAKSDLGVTLYGLIICSDLSYFETLVLTWSIECMYMNAKSIEGENVIVK